jgi:hypothetical protein
MTFFHARIIALVFGNSVHWEKIMLRLAAIVFVASFVTFGSGRADAQEPHKAWFTFLKGEWSYEIAKLDAKGTVTWRLAAKGNALVGRYKDKDGQSIEIGGWRSDTKTLVADGYGPKGNYWHVEFKKVAADGVEGTNHGVLRDGRAYKGTFIIKKIDDDHYEWHLDAKTGDGHEISLTGKYTRKKDE